mgnify:CR=1 FL=1
MNTTDLILEIKTVTWSKDTVIRLRVELGGYLIKNQIYQDLLIYRKGRVYKSD